MQRFTTEVTEHTEHHWHKTAREKSSVRSVRSVVQTTAMAGMKRRCLAAVLILTLLLPLAAAAFAVGFGEPRHSSNERSRAQGRFSWMRENLSWPYDARFIFTRIRYGGWNSSWSHDYPRADRHLPHILADLTLMNINLEASNVFDLDNPEIFMHPMIYLSEPGFWAMTDAEGQNLRHYLLKGGLIIFDDFEGRQWDNLEQNMRRALPEYRWIEIDITHPIFHSFFEMKRIDFRHPMVNVIARYMGLFENNDPHDRMIALANHNCDLAEYWEWSDTGFFSVDSTNEAYKLGVNYIVYSMTH